MLKQQKHDQEGHILFMQLALELARTAFEKDEVPVGAVIVERKTANVLAAFPNQMRQYNTAINHAEILAIQKAMKVLKNERLVGCDIFVSLEPCPMCAYAISIARLDRLFYAASDSKTGGVENGPKIFESSSCHHKPEVYSGVLASEASELLKDFFQGKRNK
jgi:tRNA(Arg) A34 adenosine deaminase TadA|tara:strand:+ start:266 stop:751 length:486 start_codon:yes stop_codon:yes gene_type:complete